MATYWIRPYSGGPYGNNDGTSYADAWYRARDVVLAAGDTLYVSGTLDDGGSDGYSFTQIFRSPSVQGTSANPITIDGAPPAQPAGRIVASGVKIETSDWTNEGSGVYSITGVSGAATWLYNEVEAWPNSDRFIFDFGSIPTSGDAPAFYKDGANKLWYAPLGGTPAATVWTSGGAFLDFFSATNTDDGLFNPDWLVIKNLTLRNLANPIRTMYNKNWVIDNVDIGWTTGTCIAVNDGTENLTIQNCDLHDATVGVYSAVGLDNNGVNEAANNCLVKDNTVHDLRMFNGSTGDCHGIAWQNGSNNRITGNTVEDCQGTGITVYIKNPTLEASRVSNYNKIDNNTVRRIENTGQASSNPASSGHGIEWTGDNTGRTSSVEKGNRIEDNTISEVKAGSVSGDGWGIRLKTHKDDAITLSGNTISDCTYGHYLYSQNVGAAAGGSLSNETVSSCVHNIGYQGTATVAGYSLSGFTYSGSGDFEVLQDDATQGKCEIHEGVWNQPSGSQCTIPTVGQYIIYTARSYMNEYQAYKGAVQPATAGGNEYQLWKGAVQPAAITATLAGIEYPRDAMPTDEARFQTFIDATGVTKSGCLATDYRRALCSVLGIADENSVSIDDAFKRYWETL